MVMVFERYESNCVTVRQIPICRAEQALNVGVILVQIWCNTLSNDNHDTHDIHEIARKHTINVRYHTYFHDIKRCS